MRTDIPNGNPPDEEITEAMIEECANGKGDDDDE